MRLAGPGHGGSRLRVRTKYLKYTQYHHGHVERRVGIFWLSIGSVCSPTHGGCLSQRDEIVAKWSNENLNRKIVTFL